MDLSQKIEGNYAVTAVPSNSTTGKHAKISTFESSGDLTLTYRCSHEPWDSFQQKVLQLDIQLFLAASIGDI